MPRLNVVDPATATGKARELFDGRLRKRQRNIYKGLANSPAVLEAYLKFAGGLTRGLLNPLEREVIALGVAQANDCDYCLAGHTAAGQMVGLTDEQILEARTGKLQDPELNAIARFVQALHEKRGRVSDDDLTTLRQAGYSDGHVVEIVVTYAQNMFTSYFNHVNQTELDFPPAPELP